MAIVVMSPTGNIGRVVVNHLLEAGVDVTVLARDPAKLTPEVRERVTVHTGDLFDEAAVRQVTEGADALFWLTPPSFTTPDWQAYHGRAAAVASGAVRANKVPYVVNQSSAGANYHRGWGPVSFLHFVEDALNETGANVLHLRPGNFYENFLAFVETIKTQGAIYNPVPPHISMPMVATKDIAAVAAQRLRAQDWQGVQIQGVHGPAQQPTFGEAATIIGEGVGRTIQYVEIPLEAFKAQLLQMGASESVAACLTELNSAFARQEPLAEPRTAETTTPTTLREWAAEALAPLIRE